MTIMAPLRTRTKVFVQLDTTLTDRDSYWTAKLEQLGTTIRGRTQAEARSRARVALEVLGRSFSDVGAFSRFLNHKAIPHTVNGSVKKRFVRLEEELDFTSA